MLRNRLRTLEQQVNASDLPDDVKVKLQGYMTGATDRSRASTCCSRTRTTSSRGPPASRAEARRLWGAVAFPGVPRAFPHRRDLPSLLVCFRAGFPEVFCGMRFAALLRDRSRLAGSPPMSSTLSRRRFLTHSLATCAAVPLGHERRGAPSARAIADPAREPVTPGPFRSAGSGRSASVKISRLICGGNLISGYAHSRDLIYVSTCCALLHRRSGDGDVGAVRTARDQHDDCLPRGCRTASTCTGGTATAAGRIQYLAQIKPDPANLKGASHGGCGRWRRRRVPRRQPGRRMGSRQAPSAGLPRSSGTIKEAGLIAGVAGHELRTPQQCEAGNRGARLLREDAARPELLVEAAARQDKDVIDNYRVDNYWCQEPETRHRLHVRRDAALDRVQSAGRRRHSARKWFHATPSRTGPTSPPSGCSTFRCPRTSSSRTRCWRRW